MLNDNDVRIKVSSSADTKGISDTQRALGDLDGSQDKASRSAGGLSSALKGMGVAAGIASAAAAAGAVTLGFGFNNAVEQAETKLQAFMKDNERVARTLAWVKDEAAKTQFSFTDMADAAAQLTPTANITGIALEDLVKQAEILAALNPAEGLTGAAFSLREALSNDWVSIVERFNLPRTRINQLKDEGVPAMEAISRVLKEMGIDYGLVSKQGQTTAATWAQITDKFNIMLGAVTQPVFDRVGEALRGLNGMDASKFSRDLTEGVKGLIVWFDEFVPRVQAVAQQVGDYLGPKFGALWDTIANRLMPTLQSFWHDHLEPLMPVLGVTFVAAVGLAIDALNLTVGALDLIIRGIGWVVTEFNNANPVIIGLAGVFGTLAAAMAFNATFSALTAGFATLTAVTIPSVVAKVVGLSALVATPMIMPALAIGAALASIATVWHEWQKTKAAIESAKSSLESQLATSKRIYNEQAAILNNGVSSPEAKERARKLMDRIATEGYAEGGFTGRGNMNEVAGVVHKGEYVVPKSQVDQNTGKPKDFGGKTVNQTNNFYVTNEVDVQQALTLAGWRLSNV